MTQLNQEQCPGTILIVEDDPKLAALIARAFTFDGRTTRIAGTGDLALLAVRTDTSIVAVVLDIMIPHPDGIEVCNQIRRNGWEGVIVAMSARIDPEARSHAHRSGADAFLPKPFRLNELIDTVRSLLHARTRSIPPPRSGHAPPANQPDNTTGTGDHR